MLPQQTTVLEQKQFLQGMQRFEIRSDGSLEITFRNFSVHRQFKIPLRHIHHESERIKYRAGGALLGTYIFGGIWIFTVVGAFMIHDIGTRMAILCFPGTLLSIPFLGCVVNLKKQVVDCVSFPTRDGGALQVWFNKPNQETFQAFCAELSNRAKTAAENNPSEQLQAKSVTAEIEGLAKLRASGVLSEAEFEAAKAKLIESIGERRIGFK